SQEKPQNRLRLFCFCGSLCSDLDLDWREEDLGLPYGGDGAPQRIQISVEIVVDALCHAADGKARWLALNADGKGEDDRCAALERYALGIGVALLLDLGDSRFHLLQRHAFMWLAGDVGAADK